MPHLWQYNFSNFNEKARWALDFKSIPHTRKSLLPGGPRALAFSARGTLPVLDLEGERVADTTRIIEALELHKPDPPLYPNDPQLRREALELEDFFDEHVGHEARRVLFYDVWSDREFVSGLLTTGRGETTRRIYGATISLAAPVVKRRYKIYPADVEEGRGKIIAGMDRIVAEAGPEGYLVGSSFSVADLTAASLLGFVAQPREFQYDYPDPPQLDFLEQVQSHPAVDWLRATYRRHRGSSMDVGKEAAQSVRKREFLLL